MAGGQDEDSATAICYKSVVEGASVESIAEQFSLQPGVDLILRELSVSGERVAFEPFKAIEPGKAYRIVPFGKWYRGTRILDITDERLQQMEANFNAGLPRYGVHINVEHGGEDGKPQGKVGTIKAVQHRKGDGLYATELEMTSAGKGLVEEDRFFGPSPELMWTLYNDSKYQDPKTGKWHDNVLVGLALTNSPFFGGDVATFSAKPRAEPDLMQKLFGMVQSLTDKVETMAQGATMTPEQQAEMKKLMEGGMSEEDARKKVMGMAPEKTNAGGNGMNEPTIAPERFAELEKKAAEVDKLSAKLADAEKQLKEQAEANKTLADKFSAEQKLRRLNEMTEAAEKFSALPAKQEELGAQLLWLIDADTTEKHDHYSYFEGLLQSMNEVASKSKLFDAFGTSLSDGETSDPFLQKVKAIQAERFADKPKAEGFTLALKAAGDEHPDLARQYQARQRK